MGEAPVTKLLWTFAVGGVRGSEQELGPLVLSPPGAVMEDARPEHGRVRDSQAATPEDPQDVAYAELDHSAVRQGATAPSNPQSGERPAEPSVYAALALH